MVWGVQRVQFFFSFPRNVFPTFAPLEVFFVVIYFNGTTEAMAYAFGVFTFITNYPY
jgi:hypothetical protein